MKAAQGQTGWRLARRYETVIVGGGIAGLACARRLCVGRRPFLLITEDVGGRIRTSSDGGVNLGAYYVRSDYTHVLQYVDRGRRIRRHHILRGDQNGSFTRWDGPLLRHLPQAVRFVRLMREFHRHYQTFKQACELISQAEAIRADPLLWRLYCEPAPRFIRRHRLEDISRAYLAPAIRGTGFTSVDGLTAFTLLVGVLPTIIPIFEYTFRFDRLTEGIEAAFVFDSVTAVTATSGHYSIRTSGADFEADNVVVATPVDVSARLLDLGPVKKPAYAHMFLVKGTLRRPWTAASYTVFPEGEPVFALARQTGGSILLSSISDKPEFGRYFSTWEIVEHHHWTPAFHLGGDPLLECEQARGLYLIGDHNVCDLEDAYITGVHAANRILAGGSSAAAGGTVSQTDAI